MDATDTKVEIVTGYVPIIGHPRPAAEYGQFAEEIFGPLAANGVPITRFMERVEDTWLWKNVGNRRNITHSVADNPKKNTLEYHCVQHQKFGWLLKAAIHKPEVDTWIWVDFGIRHLPSVTCDDIWKMYWEVKDHPGDFAIPGCWKRDQAMLNDCFPCWRFCGGVMVVPREYVPPLYRGIKRTILDHVDKTNNVWWEVNTMAELERRNQLSGLRWYQADHDDTMFTNYAKDAPPCSA